MEDIVKVVSNYGLGFGCFILLSYISIYFIKEIKTTLSEISNTLIAVQTSINIMNTRIERLENKNEKI